MEQDAFTQTIIVWCSECNEPCADSDDFDLSDHTSRHEHQPEYWNASPSHIHRFSHERCELPYSHPECLRRSEAKAVYCETNACDDTACHRCFPRKWCHEHEKCQEQNGLVPWRDLRGIPEE